MFNQILPNSPKAYDVKRIHTYHLIVHLTFKYDKSDWNEIDHAEHTAYMQAIRHELDKRKAEQATYYENL